MIKPKGFWWFWVESFESYLPKIKKHLPNFPDSIIEQWIYRHFNDFKNKHRNRIKEDLNNINFEIIDLDLNNINNNIYSVLTEEEEKYRWKMLYENDLIKNEFLCKYMKQNKKWPQPIIIIKISEFIKKTYKIKTNKIFFLLEWHRRLAYIKEIAKREKLKYKKHETRLLKIKHPLS